MSYVIKITKFEPNPNFNEELREYNSNSYRSGMMKEPEKYLETKVLEVELENEEFKQFKSEIIKIFN